ncbi:MAG: phosphomannomutase [Rhodobacteraceae bacterium]|nr:phosphomannomutase [Paracoccaceae bacterium]
MVKFGTSGVRGLAADLTDALCVAYTGAFLQRAGHSGKVLIGRDRRASSPRIAAAVARAVQVAGAEAFDCGVLPTPALALAAKRLGAPAIMVTGSHIPADRNGLKFYCGSGEITKADEAAITAGLAGAPKASSAGPPRMTPYPGARDTYVARYTGAFAPDALRGLRLGVYLHSSAARDVLPDILAALGAEVVPLGASDSFVAVDTEAIPPATLAQLRDWAARHRLDAILSTDGDADRPLVTDAQGNQIAGDLIGPLTARWLGATAVAMPLTSNGCAERMDAFNDVRRCRIGSPFVIQAMQDLARDGAGRVAGYEPNGGFLLGFEARLQGGPLAPLMTRDSVLPMLAPLAECAETGVTLKELVAALPSRAKATHRVTDIPFEVSQYITRQLAAGDPGSLPLSLPLPESLGLGPVTAIDTLDGTRLTFSDGTSLHVRPSGNAPELRIYVETDNPDRADAVLRAAVTELVKAIKSAAS